MKKAMIATAVVLVLSFISTVCFGVALGSQGLRAFFRDGGVLDEWSGAVSDWNDVILYTDAFADTDERENLFSSEGTLLEAVDSLKITANCGEVRVLQGTGEQVEVSLEQYSSRVNPSPKYVLSVPQPGEIQLSAASDLDGVAAVLTVYVPKALTALTIDVRYGSVEVRDISAERMAVTLDAGDLDLAGCTLTTAELRVNTGDIDIENTVTVTVNTDEETVGAALVALNLVSGSTSEYGLMVDTVNGITLDYNKDGMYWSFYINGEYAMTGVDATPVEADATYSFVATAA